VKISIGVAAAAASISSLGTLLGAANQALYRARAERRNRTVQWLPLLAAG
jgi:PleD family two-component response regulator